MDCGFWVLFINFGYKNIFMNFLQKYGFLMFGVILVFVTLYFANYGTNINNVKAQVDSSFYLVEAICIFVRNS